MASHFEVHTAALARLHSTAKLEIPAKRINDGDDLRIFLASTAYKDLLTWLLQLNRSMFPTRDETGIIEDCSLTSPPRFSQAVQNVRGLLDGLRALTEQAPPEQGPRRFGNVAFRTWFRLLESKADQLIEVCLHECLVKSRSRLDDTQASVLNSEIKMYLLGSFGSKQRLDYGTGHELSFLAFLGCLWKMHAFEDGEERAIVIGIVQPYLDLVRFLVLRYTLEPAGSHGVWGLDDHSFVPYIFGSAQLGPAILPTSPVPIEGSSSNAPPPKSVGDKMRVAELKDVNMYFSAIQFIYDVKRGPFWEHSPVLYDVSGIKDGWGKINKGMLKMYAAEVLGKFPVVQHFPFGGFFKFEVDPNAAPLQASIHSQQQPQSTGASSDVPTGGTQAPWAATRAVNPTSQMPAATGVPSARAPWAAQGARPPVPSTMGPPDSYRPVQRTSSTPSVLDQGRNPPR